MCSPGEQVGGIHAVGTATLEQQDDGDGWTCSSGGKGGRPGDEEDCPFCEGVAWAFGLDNSLPESMALRLRKEDGRSDRMVRMYYSPAEQDAKGSPAVEQVVWEGCTVLAHRNFQDLARYGPEQLGWNSQLILPEQEAE